MKNFIKKNIPWLVVLINFTLSEYSYIKSVVGSSTQERSFAALGYVLSEVFDRYVGRCSAKILGWQESYLGRSSKVVGSKGIAVGRNSFIKRQAWIEAVFVYNEQSFSPLIKIGERFYASDRLHLSAIDRVEIGDNCLFGSGVYISDHNHGSYKGQQQSNPSEAPIDRKLVSFGPVIIGSNVWLGDNVVIVGSVTIGDGVVVGANSVVTKDIPNFMMAAGAPLQILKTFNHDNGQWEKFEQ
jgi:acetyltransferase-like isoleucine patch superfamily enzyme